MRTLGDLKVGDIIYVVKDNSTKVEEAILNQIRLWGVDNERMCLTFKLNYSHTNNEGRTIKTFKEFSVNTLISEPKLDNIELRKFSNLEVFLTREETNRRIKENLYPMIEEQLKKVEGLKTSLRIHTEKLEDLKQRQNELSE